MKRILCFVLLLSTVSLLSAQKYTTAIGARFGSGIGLSVQQKVWGKATVEGILQQNFSRDEVRFTALLEQHNKLIGKRLNFYLGAGPHLNWNSDFETGTSSSWGLSGIAGVEFTLGRLNLSWDFQPALDLSNDLGRLRPQTGISLRYVIVKAQEQPPKWQFWRKAKRKGKKI